MSFSCLDCPKRNTCVELCKKAERYVSKDHVAQRESPYPGVNKAKDAGKNLPLDNIYFHVSKWSFQELYDYFDEQELDFPFLTPLQNKCLYLFYFKGLTYKQIAFQLSNPSMSFSFKQVRYQIHSAKRRILNISSKIKGE